jgi:transposase
MSEYGLVMPQRIAAVRACAPELLESARDHLPSAFRRLIADLLESLNSLDQRALELEKQIIAWHRQNELSKKLEAIPGVGPITASAVVATIDNARNFSNGRQLAAWLGLVPRQYSTGGKPKLLGISKRGDAYLRTLLIHGARSALRTIHRLPERAGWAGRLRQRCHPNVVAVAMANKNARIIWALLARSTTYTPEYSAAQAAA